MSDIDFNIPKSLKEALKAKRVVPFIGAGVSMSVKKKNNDGSQSSESLFPSWKGFVEILAQALRGEQKPNEADYVLSSIKIKKPKYLDALQHAQQELGESLWYKLFDESFDVPESKAHQDSLKLNKFIWKLSNNLIITTNVDRVFQWTCPQTSEFKLLDVQNVEYARLQNEQVPQRPTVWHLHGHIDNKEKVIFTREQFEAFYKQRDNDAKLQTLLSFLTQRTFLFIGFSLDDAYLREQLEYIHSIYKGGADSFYILLHKDEIEKANLLEYVKPIPFSDFGKPLEDLIAELARIAQSDDGTGKDKSGDDTPNTSADSKPDVKKPFFNVPYKSKGDEFVGRVGKVEEIWNLLNKEGRAAIGQAVIVKGLGGLGKTQLAVEYAHAYRSKYKNGVYWLVADSTVDNQIVQIANELGWINQYDKSINQIEVAKARFLKLSECLILVDNVELFDDVKDYLPKTDLHTHLLVTSREKDRRLNEVDIDFLNTDESRELLLKVARRNLTDESEKAELEQILKILGGIPLAIELVGGFLSEHSNITFAKYHQFLNEYPLDRLEKDFPNGSFTDHDRSIIQTLRISEKTIADKPLMVEILKVLAWSGSSSMGISLLQALVDTKNEYDFQTALGDALNLRLLKKDEDAERYAIHRLLAKVVQHEEPLDIQKEWHHKIVIRLIEWFRIRYFDSLFFWNFQDEIEHLETWRSQSSPDLLLEKCNLTAMKAYIPRETGDYLEAKELYKESIEIYVDNNLNDDLFFFGLQNDLGLIFNELGDYNNALECFLKSYNYHKEEKDNNYQCITSSLSNIAAALAYLERKDEALIYIKKAVEIIEQSSEKDIKVLATMYLNAGVQYGELGFFQTARKYHILSLRLLKKFYKIEHPAIADAMCNLGINHSDLGNFNKSLKYLFKGLEMFKMFFEDNHPKIPNFLHNIGAVYSKFNKPIDAVSYFEKALKICRLTLGDRHPKSIVSAASLVDQLVKLGKTEEAGRLSLEYLSYIPQNHPAKHVFESHSKFYKKRKKRHKKY